MAESQPKFRELYDLNEKVGQGAYSIVKRCTHRETGKVYAVKIVSKVGLSFKEEKELRDEVDIMKDLNHPYVVHLLGFYDEDRYFYLVIEYLPGGELFDRLVEREKYSEDVARHCVRIMCSGISYIHKQGIVHRDIKPENLLLVSSEDDDSVKICDFGLAARVVEGKLLKKACGTPGYLAPEILKGTGYGPPVDMWAIGVVTYCLLCGYPPFAVDDRNNLYKAILKCDYDFDDEDWRYVSQEARNFVEMLLEGNMYRRMTADDALEHPWMKMDDGSLSRRDLTPRLEQLKSYQSKVKFKAAATVVMATQKLHCLVNDKKKELKEDDETADGAGNEDGVMFSPPARVLVELEEHAISRSNSKTLSARIPSKRQSRVDREAMANAGAGAGMMFMDAGRKSKDDTVVEPIGTARPGILHIGSGIYRMGSSRSRDSSPRQSIHSNLSGESGRTERSRSALISADAYRALNLSFRSSHSGSYDRDEFKSNSVSIAGSKKDIWEDEDIVGSAGVAKFNSLNTAVGDGMSQLDLDLATRTPKMKPNKSPSTKKESPAPPLASKRKELSLIPEGAAKYEAGSQKSPEASVKGTVDSMPSAKSSTSSKSTGNDSSVKVPSLDMDQLGGAGHNTSKPGSLTHLPDLPTNAKATATAPPTTNSFMSRIMNRRGAKNGSVSPSNTSTRTSPPRNTSTSTATTQNRSPPRILPEISSKAPSNVNASTTAVSRGYNRAVSLDPQIASSKPKAMTAARPYVKHSSTVAVGETGHDLPLDKVSDSDNTEYNTATGNGDSVALQQARKKKKRFKGFTNRIKI